MGGRALRLHLSGIEHFEARLHPCVTTDLSTGIRMNPWSTVRTETVRKSEFRIGERVGNRIDVKHLNQIAHPPSMALPGAAHVRQLRPESSLG
jgi:hypothetical protein